MRPASTTIAPLVALLAAATVATPATARPIDSPADRARSDSTYALPRHFHPADVPGNAKRRGTHSAYKLPPDFQTADATDAAKGRGTFTAPDVTVIKLPQSARSAQGAIDWTAAGIGAGGATGLLAITLAGALTVRRRQVGTRARAALSSR